MKEKHLEFIQGIINRMGQNSFLIKGWAVTLVSALFALAAKDTNHRFVLIAYFPTIVFWMLNSYFLYKERVFRKLYNHVRLQTNTDFSLEVTGFDGGFWDWLNASLSITLILFYGVVFLSVVIAMFYL